LTTKEGRNYHNNYFLTLVFALLLFSTGILVQNVFAMGSSTCSNDYSATISSFTINNGTQVFDPIAYPGLTFQENSHSTYTVTDIVHVANQSSQGNTNPGSFWEGNNYYNFVSQNCITASSNQNVTQGPSGIYDAFDQSAAKFTQQVTVQTTLSKVTYYVEWINSSSTATTVPSVPQNLQPTASNSQVALSWSTPSNNGGSPITNYNVYRGTSSGTDTLLTSAGNVTSYTDTTVTNGQQYFYKVTAVNSVGESSQSNEASATPTAPATAPSAPTGLAATATSSSQINLSWSVPANNGGAQITGYQIERSIDNGNTWSVLVSSTGSVSTSYSDSGLSPNAAYTYRVSAINSIGTGSPSNTASATTSAIITTKGIVLSNTQSTSGTVSPSNTITIPSFNAGSDSNRLLVVGVSANNNNVASVTFGGVPLQNIASSFYNNDAEFWYLKNPSGTGDITVTMNGATQAAVGAYAFSGVNQTTPIPTHVTKHNTSPNSPKISLTTKYANDWVLDLPSIYGGSTLGSPICTQQWDANVPGAITGASSSKAVPTAETVTCGWTASSADFWDDAAVEINAAR